jgi:hypothetical protein
MNESEKLIILEQARRRAAGEQVDPLSEWRKGMPQPEPPRKERGLDAPPVDMDAHVEAIVAAEREFIMTVVGQAMKEFGDSLIDEIEHKIREQVDKIRVDFGLESTVEQLVADALSKSQSDKEAARSGEVIPLPNPLQRRG